MNAVEKIKKIFDEKPVAMDEIRSLLSSREFTKEELAEIANYFTDHCFCEYRDALNPEIDEITLENMSSNYIIDAISLLLEFGLDPNVIVNDENALDNAQWIDAPDVGATVMRMLLENGGDPNLWIPTEPETLFEYVAFKVSYDECAEYFNIFQCWLVLMAYGGCWSNGEIPITMLGGKTVDIFKNFELFDYAIEQLPKEPGKYGLWRMHIYNIETKEEVAVY